MKGKIKFFKPAEYWGKITIEGQSKDVYFNQQNVGPELLSLLIFNVLCY